MDEHNGIINVNKDAGMTSSGVVSRLRRILGQKKIGHTGTLDPMATGVLPVCAGRATRLSDYIMEKDKVYVAGLTLGARTDTGVYGRNYADASNVFGYKNGRQKII